jgi:ribosomal-protein-alanine N-acetyltransferase
MPTLGPYLPAGTLNQRTQPTLAVDNLLLRPWADDDAAAVIEAYTEPEISRFNRRTIETETEALEWIRR